MCGSRRLGPSNRRRTRGRWPLARARIRVRTPGPTSSCHVVAQGRSAHSRGRRSSAGLEPIGRRHASALEPGGAPFGRRRGARGTPGEEAIRFSRLEPCLTQKTSVTAGFLFQRPVRAPRVRFLTGFRCLHVGEASTDLCRSFPGQVAPREKFGEGILHGVPWNIPLSSTYK